MSTVAELAVDACVEYPSVMRGPFARSPLGRAAVLVLVSGATGCTTLATSPSWVGGTRAEGAPERIAKQEAELEKESREAAREPKRIGARHILVMHDGSERKPDGIARTREQAKKRAEEVLAKIRGGASFEDLVGEYSDEPGAKERNGDLGVFEKKVMVKAFAEAAFKLEVGQVSDVIETPFGFHVIKRTE
jgi:hypothetical protein